jgi:hypothetical protein
VIASPPSLDGATQLRVIFPLPAVAVTLVGAPGTVPWRGDAVMVTLAVMLLAGLELSLTVSAAVWLPTLA